MSAAKKTAMTNLAQAEVERLLAFAGFLRNLDTAPKRLREFIKKVRGKDPKAIAQLIFVGAMAVGGDRFQAHPQWY